MSVSLFSISTPSLPLARAQPSLEQTSLTPTSQISVIVEFLAGRVPDMLLKMIALYRPDCERFGFAGCFHAMGTRR
jgi:hypothetical protein